MFWLVCLFPTIFKTRKWASENAKVGQNHQKSTNFVFCDNSIDKSLALILKYMVCKFYGCGSAFKKIRMFWKNNSCGQANLSFVLNQSKKKYSIDSKWKKKISFLTRKYFLKKVNFFNKKNLRKFVFFQNILISLTTLVQTIKFTDHIL